MGYFSSNICYRICSADWIAKTYAEYLMTCANDQLKMIEELGNIITDSALDELIDAKTDEYQDLCDAINKDINNILLSSRFNPNSKAIIDIIRNLDHPDHNELVDLIIPVFFECVEGQPIVATEYSLQLAAFSPYWNLPEIIPATKPYTWVREWFLGEFDDYIMSNGQVEAAINNLVANASINLNIDYNAPITLDDGFVKFADLARDLINKSIANSTDLSSAGLTATDSLGNILSGELVLTPSEIFDQLKKSAASSIAWSYGFQACVKSNVSDRLAYFEAQIKNYFNEMNATVNASIQTVRSTLAAVQTGARDFIDMADELIGWSSLTDQGGVVSATDMQQYTGASPISSVDLHTLKGVGTIAIGAIVAAAKGVWSAIKAGSKKLWPKIRPYVQAITTNPDDVETIDTDATSYTAAGMMWSNFDVQNQSVRWLDILCHTPTEAANVAAMWQSRLNKVYAYNTLFSECIVKVSDVWSPAGGDHVRLAYQAQLKPRCVDPDKAVQYGLVQWHKTLDTNTDGIVSNTLPIDNFINFENEADKYVKDADDEKRKYAGWQTGLVCHISAWNSVLAEMYASGIANSPIVGYQSNLRVMQYYYQFILGNDGHGFTDRDYHVGLYATKTISSKDSHYEPISSIDNLDLATLLTGWNGSYGSTAFFDQATYLSYSPRVNTSDQTWSMKWESHLSDFMSILMAPVLAVMTLQFWDREHNRYDYVYVPYSTDNYLFEDPRYRIKTDQNNIQLADLICSAITAVVVVVLAIVVSKAIIKLIKNAKYAKAKRYVGMMDNAMWNGKKMTLKETRKYKRKLRKISAMESFSSGFAAAQSTGSSIVDTLGGKVSELTATMTSKLLPNNSVNATYNDDVNYSPESALMTSDSNWCSMVLYAITKRDHLPDII